VFYLPEITLYSILIGEEENPENMQSTNSNIVMLVSWGRGCRLSDCMWWLPGILISVCTLKIKDCNPVYE